MEYHRQMNSDLEKENPWEKVFEKFEPILNYYVERLRDQAGGEYQNIRFPHEIQHYVSSTFQDYIDKTINIHSIGTYDYQRFTENMKDFGFRSKLYEKFEMSMARNRLKNHLLFILELHCQRDRNKDTYRTPTESEYIDTVLDATTYFDYLATRDSKEWEEENRALALIDRLLFV
jgi:hypothetical protein